MRILVVLILFMCAFATQAQDTKKDLKSDSVNLGKDFPKALYVVDGIKIKDEDATDKTWGEVLNIPTEKITSITVIKGEDAIEKYGDEGKNGVILITTRPIQPTTEPLYIVDGVETKNIKVIDTNNIQSISVLKDEEHTLKYGSKGKNGVIIITTKK